MATNIDRKLRLTAALLGAVTRKDLALAFRKVNPSTAFDVDRADKWLQGRAQPRQAGVYDDWTRLLELSRPANWIADCSLDVFLQEICSLHARDRADIERRADSFGKQPTSGSDDRRISPALVGSYICYSHSWSPYYRGSLLRSTAKIENASACNGLVVTYSENLPTGRLICKGSVHVARRGLSMHVSEIGGDGQFLFSLFPFSAPGSVLGGYMSGATIIGPEPQPSVTRLAMIRIPQADRFMDEWGAYLPSTGSPASDLAEIGFALETPERVNDCLYRFLAPEEGRGADQISPHLFRSLLDLFDRHWLGEFEGRLAGTS